MDLGHDRHAATGPTPLRVHAVRSASELAELGGVWERLTLEAEATSVFAGYDWQSLWWRTYGRGRPLRTLVAAAGDQVVGVLALYVHTERILGVPVRILRFVGTGDVSPPVPTTGAPCSRAAASRRSPPRWPTPSSACAAGTCCR
jgi:hypothetical protein